MTIAQLIFILFAIVTLASAFMVVTQRNLFHSALFLIVSFFGVAALYVLLEAYFFAAAQVLVYIGAIAILLIFAVMLTRGVMNATAVNTQWQAAAVIGGLMFASLAILLGPAAVALSGRVFGNPQWALAGRNGVLPTVSETSLANLGKGFVDANQYAVPFLLSGVLILLAMVGAIWVARERKPAEVLAERAELERERESEEAQSAPEPASMPETAHATTEHH